MRSSVLDVKIMENRSRKIAHQRKRSLAMDNEESCSKKRILRARRKLLFDEEPDAGSHSPAKADVRSRVFDSRMDLVAEVTLADELRCISQYNFDIIAGKPLAGTYEWESIEGATPTKLQKCSEVRRSLVH